MIRIWLRRNKREVEHLLKMVRGVGKRATGKLTMNTLLHDMREEHPVRGDVGEQLGVKFCLFGRRPRDELRQRGKARHSNTN